MRRYSVDTVSPSALRSVISALVSSSQVINALKAHLSLTQLDIASAFAEDVVRMLSSIPEHPLCDLTFREPLSASASDALAVLIQTQQQKVCTDSQ